MINWPLQWVASHRKAHELVSAGHMPASMVRLSAGRLSLSDEAQALCFLAGANSIFMGEKLLTTPNPGKDEDQLLLDRLGMHLSPAN